MKQQTILSRGLRGLTVGAVYDRALFVSLGQTGAVIDRAYTQLPVLVCLLCLLCSTTAQTAQTVQGTVCEIQSCRPIAGARILVASSDPNGTMRTALSNIAG